MNWQPMVHSGLTHLKKIIRCVEAILLPSNALINRILLSHRGILHNLQLLRVRETR